MITLTTPISLEGLTQRGALGLTQMRMSSTPQRGLSPVHKRSVLKRSILLLLPLLFLSCGFRQQATTSDTTTATPVGPVFSADSAYAFCQAQCSFGSRTMNSPAHDACARWIVTKFTDYGMTVTEQHATLTGYDGTPLRCTNIIASYNPDAQDRILLCAHWDSRPWADNDPDSANHHTPVLAANDGASGVAVMLEIARLISGDKSLSLGLDFICFDAEDYGTPQWSTTPDPGNTWALGSQHWAASVPKEKAKNYRFGILLDMVGGGRPVLSGTDVALLRPQHRRESVARSTGRRLRITLPHQRGRRHHRRSYPRQPRGEDPLYRHHPPLSRLRTEFLRPHVAHHPR